MASVKIEKAVVKKGGKTHRLTDIHVRRAGNGTIVRKSYERVHPQAPHMPDPDPMLFTKASQARKHIADAVDEMHADTASPETATPAMADESSNTAGGEQFAGAPPIAPNPE